MQTEHLAPVNDAAEPIRRLVDDVYHAESRRVLATLIRLLGDFDLAEDALHDAFAAALRTELMTQADLIAEALDTHASGGIARRDRGLWPRQERR